MNAFYKIKHNISLNMSSQDIVNMLIEDMPNKMYSYLLKRTETYWKCHFTISTVEEYNTIDKNTAIVNIIQQIDIKQTIHDQPSLSLMLEIFTPYIHSLVYEQSLRWQQLEYEDLLQMCYLSLCKLYNKDYYINSYLLRTTFVRDVLLSVRKQRTDYTIISIDNTYGKDDSLTIDDTLEDTRFRDEQDNKEHLEEIKCIFNAVKDVIVNLIGERRFDQLYREYKDKTTTNNGRQTLARIKREFNKKGFTLESFRRKL